MKLRRLAFLATPGILALALEDLPEVALVAVERGGQWLGAPPQLRLQPGDQVAVSATPPALEAARELLGGRRSLTTYY